MTTTTLDQTDFRIHKIPLIASATVISVTLALAISTWSCKMHRPRKVGG